MGSLWGLLYYTLSHTRFGGSSSSHQSKALRHSYERHWKRSWGGVPVEGFLKSVGRLRYLKQEVRNEEVGKMLWAFSEKQIEAVEKESAQRRASEKAGKEEERRTSGESGRGGGT